MNKSFVIGGVLGAIVVTAGAAVAGFKMMDGNHEAKVLSARAVTHTVRTPHQECHDEQVVRQKPTQDPNHLAGMGIGAVVGGLLGHEVGGGSGKVLATVAGAAAGGYAGNKIEQKVQQGETYTTTEQRCATVYDTHEEPAGYEVEYEFDGKRHRIHMDHDPGDHLPVKDGQVVTTAHG